MFSDYCLMILQIIITEGLHVLVLNDRKIIAVHAQDVTFSWVFSDTVCEVMRQ